MKNYLEKVCGYTLIGIICSGLYGCESKIDIPKDQKKLQTKVLFTNEDTSFVFNKSTISDDLMKDYGSTSLGVTSADLDGDRDLDIIVATEESIIIYENRTKQFNTQVEKLEK